MTSTLPALTFVEPTVTEQLAPGAIVTAIRFEDVNQDGLSDVILSGFEPVDGEEGDQGFLRLFHATSDYEFADPALLASEAVDSLLVADLDANGLLDVLADRASGGVLVVAAEDAEDAGSFREPQYLDVAGTLADVTDLDGNGLLDLVTQLPSVLLVHKQVEDGFAEAVSYSGGIGLASRSNPLAVGDVDSDGDVDFVTICSVECDHLGQLIVRLNDGVGGFDFTIELPGVIENQLLKILLQDVDGDDQVEVVPVSTDTDSTRIEILSLSLDSSFESRSSFEIPGIASQVQFVDFNQDMLLDMLVNYVPLSETNTHSGMAVLLATESEFGSPIAIPTEYETILGTRTDGTIVTMRSDTSLAFQPGTYQGSLAKSATNYTADFDTRSASVVDANRDGYLDIVGPEEKGIGFLLGARDGSFDYVSLQLPSLQSFRMYVDQFDDDSGTDIVVVGIDAEMGHTSVLRIELNGDTPEITDSFVTDPGIVIQTIDLDADGLMDFVLRSEFQSSEEHAFVLLNRSETWLLSRISDSVATAAVEDLDGDGIQEIYVFEQPMKIFRYQNDAFQPWGEVPKGTTRATVLDFDNDNRKEFLSITKQSQGTTLVVHSQQEAGIWTSWDAVSANSHALLDVNGDRLIDIVSPRHFYINNGDGTWLTTAELDSESPEWAERNRYLDLNNDGLTDNAKWHATTGRLTLHELTNDNAWKVSEFSGIVGPDFEFVDFNADGLADLTELSDGTLNVSMRTADGWLDRQSLATDASSYLHVLRNDDNLIDLAVVADYSVSYFIQDESGSFNVEDSMDTGPVLAVDVNGDGLVDLQSMVVDSIWKTTQEVRLGSETGFDEARLQPKDEPDFLWIDSTLRARGADVVELYTLPVDLDSTTYVTKSVDIDGDGDLDAILFRPDGVLVLLGSGAGDFDANGRVQADDLNLLRNAIRSELQQPADFDLNADGKLDAADEDYWLVEIANTRPGDSDMDGDVDFRDFLQLTFSFEKTDATWSDGDFDGDGVVTFVDFLRLAKEFDKSRPNDR